MVFSRLGKLEMCSTPWKILDKFLHVLKNFWNIFLVMKKFYMVFRYWKIFQTFFDSMDNFLNVFPHLGKFLKYISCHGKFLREFSTPWKLFSMLRKVAAIFQPIGLFHQFPRWQKRDPSSSEINEKWNYVTCKSRKNRHFPIAMCNKCLQ